MSRFSFVLVALAAFLVLSGCFRTRADIAKEREAKEVRTSLQQSVVEYNQSVERIQADVGRLQGKIEEIEHHRKREMGTYAASSEGLAKTVGDLKVKVEELQKSQATLFDEIKRLREENVQMLRTLSRSAPAAAPASGQKKNTGASFTDAMNAYRAKNYSAAAAGFRAYLAAYPRGRQVLNARYHLGDSLYRMKEYTDAIAEFGVVHERSPASSLGRRSTLRIAESFKALGKDKEASAFAQLLVKASPDSQEAKRAKRFLR
jgi:TolA-binding protein